MPHKPPLGFQQPTLPCMEVEPNAGVARLDTKAAKPGYVHPPVYTQQDLEDAHGRLWAAFHRYRTNLSEVGRSRYQASYDLIQDLLLRELDRL